MSDRCFRDEELDALAALADDDVRLDHQKRCGRCRALLATYREFQSPALPGEAKEEQAVTEIAAALDRVIDSDAASGPSPGILGRLLRTLSVPALRPVWLAAAAVVLILTVRQVFVPFGESEIGSALRGDSEAGMIAAEGAWLEDGSLRISWEPSGAAERYAVVILDTDLREIDRIDAGARVSARLSASKMDAYPGRDAGLLWQVIALQAGQEVARSAMNSIDPRLP